MDAERKLLPLPAVAALTLAGALAGAALPAALAAAQPARDDVVIRVELVRSGGRPATGVPLDEVVVAWTARRTQGQQRAAAGDPGEYEIVTRAKAFRPGAIAVPAGSRVRFPNGDPILHNVFSVSSGNEFDLGLYQRGEGKAVTFAQPGLVRVFCNVHRDMFAYVLVIESPILGRAGRDGIVSLSGLPPGPGTLTVWHPRGEVQARELTSPAAIPAAIEVEVGRRQVPPHNNKFGKPYRATRRYDR